MHLLGIDLPIHNHPGASPELRSRRQVHRHWLLIGAKRLHNKRTGLFQENKAIVR